jgi:hypothetical protein
LLDYLEALAKRFPGVVWLETGSGRQPCYKLKIAGQSGTANPLGTERPGIIYADWLTKISGLAKAWPDLAGEYRRRIEPVLKRKTAKEWGQIHMTRQEHLEVVRSALEWLVQRVAGNLARR